LSLTKEKIFQSNKIHFIGIGGAGMNALAEYYLRHGVKISGSDLTRNISTGRLEKLGIEVNYNHSPENIPLDTDVVVYTPALSESNVEFLEAKKRGLQIVKRAELLGITVNDKKLVAVAGTHGKTTTSAMIGKVLIDSGFDPTLFIGGNVEFMQGASTRLGSGDFAVVEADEYDRSFHYLKPDLIVITSIELDHSDIYSGQANLEESFEIFLSKSKTGAKVIYCGDDKVVSGLVKRSGIGAVSYGLTADNFLVVSDYKSIGKSAEFKINGDYVKLSVPGIHNALNATASFGIASELGITIEKYSEAIERFSGVDRRLQLVYNNEIDVYDDYAHHPTEVKASLNALKEISKGNVITVFQPHLYSRTKDFHSEFADALALSDSIVLLEIYPAREEKIPGIESSVIKTDLVEKYGKDVLIPKTVDELNLYLSSIVHDGDILVFMGAGNVTNYCSFFLNYLKGIKI